MSEKDPLRLLESKRRITDSDPINNQILEAVVKLGNTVLSNKAAAELNGYDL